MYTSKNAPITSKNADVPSTPMCFFNAIQYYNIEIIKYWYIKVYIYKKVYIKGGQMAILIQDKHIFWHFTGMYMMYGTNPISQTGELELVLPPQFSKTMRTAPEPFADRVVAMLQANSARFASAVTIMRHAKPYVRIKATAPEILQIWREAGIQWHMGIPYMTAKGQDSIGTPALRAICAGMMDVKASWFEPTRTKTGRLATTPVPPQVLISLRFSLADKIRVDLIDRLIHAATGVKGSVSTMGTQHTITYATGKVQTLIASSLCNDTYNVDMILEFCRIWNERWYADQRLPLNDQTFTPALATSLEKLATRIGDPTADAGTVVLNLPAPETQELDTQLPVRPVPTVATVSGDGAGSPFPFPSLQPHNPDGTTAADDRDAPDTGGTPGSDSIIELDSVKAVGQSDLVRETGRASPVDVEEELPRIPRRRETSPLTPSAPNPTTTQAPNAPSAPKRIPSTGLAQPVDQIMEMDPVYQVGTVCNAKLQPHIDDNCDPLPGHELDVETVKYEMRELKKQWLASRGRTMQDYERFLIERQRLKDMGNLTLPTLRELTWRVLGERI